MSEKAIIINDPEESRDNEVRPFQIEGQIDGTDLRGRAVRLGTLADKILAQHNYPDSVASILGEALALGGLLGSMLKDVGVVTLQLKTKGPIPLLVADVERLENDSFRVRGYADIDQVKLDQYGKSPSFHGLIGSKQGYLALTIDEGLAGDPEGNRYQGIVELTGETLSEVAERYFRDSEQTPTSVTLRCGRDPVSGHWRAGGIILQHLSRGEEGRERIQSPAGIESWNRAMVLKDTIQTDELLDPQLTLDTLLFRLYHEDGVRVFEPARLIYGCRCSREKLMGVLAGFAADDLSEMAENGKVDVNCQFCNTTYIFGLDELS